MSEQKIDPKDLPIQETGYKFTPLKVDSVDEMFGPVIDRQIRDGFRVDVRRGEGGSVTEAQSAQLIDSGIEALRLAQLIVPGIRRNVTISCADIEGYMNTTYQASQLMVDDIPASQTAATLHELLENYQEDNIPGINTDYLPQVAEFLFTGETRVPRFKFLTDTIFNGNSWGTHEEGWEEALDALLPERKSSDPEEVFAELLKKRDLPEEEKIEIVQKAIEKARKMALEEKQ